MKTIKERAEKYGIESAYLLCSDGWNEEQRQKQAKVYAMVYSKIATEQKAIDIDKACEWLERANSALSPCYKMFEVNIENFRKAMEEWK